MSVNGLRIGRDWLQSGWWGGGDKAAVNGEVKKVVPSGQVDGHDGKLMIICLPGSPDDADP